MINNAGFTVTSCPGQGDSLVGDECKYGENCLLSTEMDIAKYCLAVHFQTDWKYDTDI